jgi:hypothetical protein
MSFDLPGLDRFLSDSFLEGVDGLSMLDLRSARTELQEAEAALSYVRRMIQGRLDIVAAQRARRSGGSAASGTAALDDLVDQLPGILADDGARNSNRLVSQVELGDAASGLIADLDRQIGPDPLADLPSLSDADLGTLTDTLAGVERDLSDSRRVLHERIDALQSELVRRYKSGEASVDSLLS